MDFWVPVVPGGGETWNRDQHALIGRLRPDVDVAAASARVNAAALAIPLTVDEDSETTVHGAHVIAVSGLPGHARPTLLTGFGLISTLGYLILLIGSANVAAMLMNRTFARRRELALRLAIGAGRRQIVRQLVVECLAVFALGGAAGIGLAYAGTRWLSRPPSADDPMTSVFASLTSMPTPDLSPDLPVLGWALALTLVTGLLFGLAPALQASRTNLVAAIKEGGAQGGTRTGRMQRVFIAAQTAASIVLLLTAALLMRSLQKSQATEPGFRTEGVVVARVDLEPRGYTPAEGREFYAKMLERIRATPGVQAAGLSSLTFLGFSIRDGMVGRAEDTAERPTRFETRYFDVDPELLGVTGIEIAAGRGITAADVEGGPPVVVVNEALADLLWPGQNAIGRRVAYTDAEREVVGVTRDSRHASMATAPKPVLFIPFEQDYQSAASFHVLAPGAEAAVQRAILEHARELDPNVAVTEIATLTQMVDVSLALTRLASRFLGGLGLLGLTLAGIGLYGVLAFNVGHRTREFAVRRALGAKPKDLSRQVVRHAAILVGPGCLIGLVAAGLLAPVGRSILFEVSPLDPVSFLAVPVLAMIVAVFASLRPVAQALAVEPAVAMREE
jgi:predicted permease